MNSEQRLDSIPSSVAFIPDIFSLGRFCANPVTRLKFEVYGRRVYTVGVLLERIFWGIMMEMEVRNVGSFNSTLDYNRLNFGSCQFGSPHPKSWEDCKAMPQDKGCIWWNQGGLKRSSHLGWEWSHHGLSIYAIQTADTFVQGTISFIETWDPILKKVKTFQDIGNYVREVSPLPASFTMIITHPVT
jgi:hypothetical protein